MIRQYKIVEMNFIDIILKKWKPKCIFCKRELLPMGPNQYFCNYEKCNLINKIVVMSILVEYSVEDVYEEKNGIHEQTTTKETEKTEEIETKKIIGNFTKDITVKNPRRYGKIKFKQKNA